jgi:hypothetical protein
MGVTTFIMLLPGFPISKWDAFITLFCYSTSSFVAAPLYDSFLSKYTWFVDLIVLARVQTLLNDKIVVTWTTHIEVGIFGEVRDFLSDSAINNNTV